MIIISYIPFLAEAIQFPRFVGNKPRSLPGNIDTQGFSQAEQACIFFNSVNAERINIVPASPNGIEEYITTFSDRFPDVRQAVRLPVRKVIAADVYRSMTINGCVGGYC